MTVSDIMTTEVIATRENTTLKDAAGLLAKFRIHGMPIIDEEKKVVGIITESDFFMKDSSNIYLPTFLDFISREQSRESKMGSSEEIEAMSRVRDVMTKDCTTVKPELPLKELINLIKEKNFKTLPVTDMEGVLVGVVTVYDIIKLL